MPNAAAVPDRAGAERLPTLQQMAGHAYAVMNLCTYRNLALSMAVHVCPRLCQRSLRPPLSDGNGLTHRVAKFSRWAESAVAFVPPAR